MPSVLCIAGLDPSGHAGLSADIRALEFLGVECLPIATALTVQNSKELREFMAVEPAIILRQLEAVFSDMKPDAVKIGMLGNDEIARTVVDFLGKRDLPVVIDPVLRSTSGYDMADADLIEFCKTGLLKIASILTPNAIEAHQLSGIKVINPEEAKLACKALHEMGAPTVLIKGGHFTESKGTDLFYDGQFHMIEGTGLKSVARGTGCTYSSLIAGHLARGSKPLEAVRMAKSDMARILMISESRVKISADRYLGAEESVIWHELNEAVSKVLLILRPEYIAEVGNNLAYATKNAQSHESICSLDSRILLKGSKAVTLGRPVFGRDSHVGRVVLAAMNHDKSIRSAMNLRYSEQNLRRVKKAGLSVGSFDRSNEPESSSSMEWGTGKAIEEFGSVPDAIYDLGSVGKEPMIRLLAENPCELITKLIKISEAGK